MQVRKPGSIARLKMLSRVGINFSNGPSQVGFLSSLCSQSKCSLQGLNPRPMAHKTIALTTELRELGAGAAEYKQNKRGVKQRLEEMPGYGAGAHAPLRAVDLEPTPLTTWAKWRTQPLSLCDER